MIHGRGPMHADIIVVGEAPGRREMILGQPFVGPSGRLLYEWIEEAGLDPATVRYENVYPTLPPGGEIQAVPARELSRWQEDCLARLDDCLQAKIIVPTGNVALGTLLGVPYQQANITQRRGSIYLWEHVSGRKVKVIPVIHPAAVLREEGERSNEGGQQTKKSYEFRCRWDWRKIAQELHGNESVPPKRHLRVQPPPRVWAVIVQGMLACGRPLAFDIETNPAQGKILCMSFANEATRAVSVPWAAGYTPGIRALLESDIPKITQNGHYDCLWLAQEGFTVNAWEHDTMAKSCLLWPGEPHSLAYLASILTREPWYKGGDEDTGEKHWKVGSEQPDRWRALLEYNARDAAVTWEVNEQEERVLREKGWTDIYRQEYQALFMPILQVMCHGMRVERGEMQEAYQEAMRRAASALAQARQAAGRELFTFNTQVQEACWRVAYGEWDAHDPTVAKKLKRVKGAEEKYIAQVEAKGISNAILAKVLYEEMGMPVQRSRRTQHITTDEVHLLKLRARFKEHARFSQGIQLIESVLRYREQKKQSETLNPERLDTDDRFRSSYSFRPSTGRLASSGNPKGTGGNAQNVHRSLRHPFKPDEGCVLTEVDLSQAEARVVYCLTGDRHLIELAHTRPGTFDCHSYMASEVFGFGPWDVTQPEGQKQKSDDRYLSKGIVHGTHYDLHGNKGSEICLKDGYDISPKRFEALQGTYKRFAPGINRWQQRTRMEGLTQRKLQNSWGRVIEFPYDKPGDDWYRRLYAWRPQSDIAAHLNRGWVRFEQWLQDEGLAGTVRVNGQLHDALLFSSPLEVAYEAMCALVTILEEPHEYYGEMLTIPAEMKVGMAWGEGIAWKALPEREEFMWKMQELGHCNIIREEKHDSKGP
jgi:DNA polymerase